LFCEDPRRRIFQRKLAYRAVVNSGESEKDGQSKRTSRLKERQVDSGFGGRAQPFLEGKGGSLNSVLEVEFIQDVAEMVLDGVIADA
jgi:hypothetical protein